MHFLISIILSFSPLMSADPICDEISSLVERWEAFISVWEEGCEELDYRSLALAEDRRSCDSSLEEGGEMSLREGQRVNRKYLQAENRISTPFDYFGWFGVCPNNFSKPSEQVESERVNNLSGFSEKYQGKWMDISENQQEDRSFTLLDRSGWLDSGSCNSSYEDVFSLSGTEESILEEGCKGRCLIIPESQKEYRLFPARSHPENSKKRSPILFDESQRLFFSGMATFSNRSLEEDPLLRFTEKCYRSVPLMDWVGFLIEGGQPICVDIILDSVDRLCCLLCGDPSVRLMEWTKTFTLQMSSKQKMDALLAITNLCAIFKKELSVEFMEWVDTFVLGVSDAQKGDVLPAVEALCTAAKKEFSIEFIEWVRAFVAGMSDTQKADVLSAVTDLRAISRKELSTEFMTWANKRTQEMSSKQKVDSCLFFVRLLKSESVLI